MIFFCLGYLINNTLGKQLVGWSSVGTWFNFDYRKIWVGRKVFFYSWLVCQGWKVYLQTLRLGVESFVKQCEIDLALSDSVHVMHYNSNKLGALLFKQKLVVLFNYVKFQQLTDLTAVDWFGKNFGLKSRFLLCYLLLGFLKKFRLIFTICWSDRQLLYSITDIFCSAEWMERECFDMFGIYVTGSLDLRRILTDYGFRGFPLRKDFPVIGFKQVKFDVNFGSIVYEPLFLMQNEREMLFVNPWSARLKRNVRDSRGLVYLRALFESIVDRGVYKVVYSFGMQTFLACKRK